MRLSGKNRYPWPVMEKAILLSVKRKLSLRHTARKLLDMGVKVSHKTIAQWIFNFKDDVKYQTRCRVREMYEGDIEVSRVTCNGENLFLYQNLNVKKSQIDIFLIPYKNIGVARKYFKTNKY